MVGAKLKGAGVFLGITGLTQGLALLGKGHIDPNFTRCTILQTTAGIAMGVQLAGFLPAYLFQTEKFYDITGSLTYGLCIGYSLVAGKVANGGIYDWKAKLVSTLAVVWAVRLGSFLFSRILKEGKDRRFDTIKPNFLSFLTAWSLQGLWVFLTAFPVLIVDSSQGLTQSKVSPLSLVGLTVWTLGFVIESVADHQKSVWRVQPL